MNLNGKRFYMELFMYKNEVDDSFTKKSIFKMISKFWKVATIYLSILSVVSAEKKVSTNKGEGKRCVVASPEGNDLQPTVISNTTLRECKDACLGNSSCTSIMWDSSNFRCKQFFTEFIKVSCSSARYDYNIYIMNYLTYILIFVLNRKNELTTKTKYVERLLKLQTQTHHQPALRRTIRTLRSFQILSVLLK
jgi:hypothetical protein